MSELQLKKTKLLVRDSNVLKANTDGSIVARFPLGAVRDVRVEAQTDYLAPLIIFVLFGSLAVVCKLYISNPLWSWLAVFFCLCIIGFGLFGMFSHRLVIETNEGHACYSITDSLGDAQGFAVSIKLLASGRSPVGIWQATIGDSSVLLEFGRGPWEGTYKQLVEIDDKQIREFGSWSVYCDKLQMLILATDIPEHPRFGINMDYSISYLDDDRIRIDGPERPNLLFIRAPVGMRLNFDEANIASIDSESSHELNINEKLSEHRIE